MHKIQANIMLYFPTLNFNSSLKYYMSCYEYPIHIININNSIKQGCVKLKMNILSR